MSKPTEQQAEALRRLAEQPEKSIDTGEIPEVTDWSGAERAKFYRPVKQQVTLRIDADLLPWFKARGKQVPDPDQCGLT